MITAAERLVQLAGRSGTAAALLMAVASGTTTGDALVNYSGLPDGSAAEHILAEHAVAAGGQKKAWERRDAAVSVANPFIQSGCSGLTAIGEAAGALQSVGATTFSRLHAVGNGFFSLPSLRASTGGFLSASGNAFVAVAGNAARAKSELLSCSGDGVGRVVGGGYVGGTAALTARGVINPSDEQITTMAFLLTRKKPRVIHRA